MRAVHLVWLAAAGCGHVGFDLESEPEPQPIAPTCPALAGGWTLEPPVLVPELSSPATDREVYLAADGLTAYVSNITTDFWQSYQSSRSTPAASWQPLTPTPWVDATFPNVTRVAITADGLEAFAAAAPTQIEDDDLWITSRPTPGMAFGPWTRLDTLSTPACDVDPYPSDDGLRLYFVVQDTSVSRLMVAERPTRDAPFGAATPVPGIVDDHADNPAVTPDSLMLLYSSHPTANAGPGDIMIAVRSSPAEPFGAPQPLPVVNGTADDTEADLWGCELYFASDRAGASGELDIYRSRVVSR